jgi:nitric oxide reductase large subunit
MRKFLIFVVLMVILISSITYIILSETKYIPDSVITDDSEFIESDIEDQKE